MGLGSGEKPANQNQLVLALLSSVSGPDHNVLSRDPGLQGPAAVEVQVREAIALPLLLVEDFYDYTTYWSPEETMEVLDLNFDGNTDFGLFGWSPNNTYGLLSLEQLALVPLHRPLIPVEVLPKF